MLQDLFFVLPGGGIDDLFSFGVIFLLSSLSDLNFHFIISFVTLLR
jgi:hypothetical protein